MLEIALTLDCESFVTENEPHDLARWHAGRECGNLPRVKPSTFQDFVAWFWPDIVGQHREENMMVLVHAGELEQVSHVVARESCFLAKFTFRGTHR